MKVRNQAHLLWAHLLPCSLSLSSQGCGDNQDDGDGHDDDHNEDEDEKDGNRTLMRFNKMLTLQLDVDHIGQDEDGYDHHKEEEGR